MKISGSIEFGALSRIVFVRGGCGTRFIDILNRMSTQNCHVHSRGRCGRQGRWSWFFCERNLVYGIEQFSLTSLNALSQRRGTNNIRLSA